jgi:hypothetical protein
MTSLVVHALAAICARAASGAVEFSPLSWANSAPPPPWLLRAQRVEEWRACG